MKATFTFIIQVSHRGQTFRTGVDMAVMMVNVDDQFGVNNLLVCCQ